MRRLQQQLPTNSTESTSPDITGYLNGREHIKIQNRIQNKRELRMMGMENEHLLPALPHAAVVDTERLRNQTKRRSPSDSHATWLDHIWSNMPQAVVRNSPPLNSSRSACVRPKQAPSWQGPYTTRQEFDTAAVPFQNSSSLMVVSQPSPLHRGSLATLHTIVVTEQQRQRRRPPLAVASQGT
ncbi:unnamed protein product [Ectocarpus sp. 12 AP-2014]